MAEHGEGLGDAGWWSSLRAVKRLSIKCSGGRGRWSGRPPPISLPPRGDAELRNGHAEGSALTLSSAIRPPRLSLGQEALDWDVASHGLWGHVPVCFLTEVRAPW